jgi:AcrR family transcriptional regulator
MARAQTDNRLLRTRKDLLQAATRLLHSGKSLTMDDIAKEALVSRATAYRYFTDVDELMAEVAIDSALPEAKEIFRESASSSMAERLDHAETVMHDFVYKNEKQLRQLLSRNLAKPKASTDSTTTPARQNRRSEYIEEALEPFRAEFDTKTFKKLTESLALVFGPEAMIVFRDVIPLDEQRAREVKRWMLTSLVNAALRESRSVKKRN